MTNGKPDDGYLYWKWKPYGCDVLPPFEGKTFLEGLRGKHWALVGDSILRNHVQSLLCLLSKVEDPTVVYHDETWRSRRWHFPLHNFTLSLVWAPFLAKAEISEDENGISSSENRLHLDVLDANWISQWNGFDYVIISAGQWFLKPAVYLENGAAIGCHNCQDKSQKEIAVEHSFRRSLAKVLEFITTSSHKPVVLYRTWSPSHFEKGEWFSGGTCDRKVPFKPRQTGDRQFDRVMWRIERAEFAKAAADDGPGNPGRLKLLDMFELSLQRPDAHAGPYKTYQPFQTGSTGGVQNDCLHWCLPGGPVEAWNDILMQMLLEDGALLVGEHAYDQAI
ncbi:protein trichome birefringence-like 24 [Lolium perenne]|uniref:protein trichome birefringence-like 24 n=1 Tax=Lolium perenne TaxID=4522 RepID=UPI0021F58821|nr:protein trichome birefringence-like 24 [Lolium perenne]